jgi:hypothetical protein
MPLGALALLTALACPQDAWTPKLAVAQGEERLMDLKVELAVEGGPLVYTATVVEQVTAVTAEGNWTVKTEHREPKLTMAGQDVAFQNDAALQTETTFGPDGSVAWVGGEAVGNDSWRVSRLSALVWPGRPLAVGDAWDWSVPADTDRGLPGLSGKATLVGAEESAGKPAMKVTFEAKEQSPTPATVTATAWYDAASARLLRLEASLKSVPLGSGTADAQVTLAVKTASARLGS